MMKHEFENLVEMTVDPNCYEKIEYVYMNSEQFSNSNGKQEIADFYKKHDMNGSGHFKKWEVSQQEVQRSG